MPGLGADFGEILVADADRRSRAQMCQLLRGAGHRTHEVASGAEALATARREPPRLAILEVNLPDICGYHVCRALRQEFADRLAIALVSGARTESYDRVAGLLLGADEYLAKPIAADELLARVGRLVRRPPASERATQLTPRERDVLELLAQGLRQREIARSLTISEKTVGTHVEHLFSKLGAHNRAQAVALAYRRGLVAPPA